MTTDLLVIGAGGFGRETLDVIEAMNRAGTAAYHVTGVADDGPRAQSLARLGERGYRHLGSIAGVVKDSPLGSYALAIGAPEDRRRVAAFMDAAGWRPVTLFHPAAGIGSRPDIGEGCIVCAGVQVSTNVRLGRYVHLNPNATVGHDAVVAEFVSVNPGVILSGEVEIETGVLVGSGAVVLQGLSVGHSSTIGALSCVTRDVPPNVVVKGVPGRWT